MLLVYSNFNRKCHETLPICVLFRKSNLFSKVYTTPISTPVYIDVNVMIPAHVSYSGRGRNLEALDETHTL